MDDINDRVADLINDAIVSQSDEEKLLLLLEIQELVISNDIIDNFLDEVIAFQADTSTEIRKFIVQFIENSCKKDGDCFAKLILNLNILINDQNANVVKKAIQSATQLYKTFLKWLLKVKVTDEVISTWEVWSQIKTYICQLLETAENEGVKTQAVKFVETIVIVQTVADLHSGEEEINASKFPSNFKVFTIPDLHEEALQAFEQLVVFHGTAHISSVNLMACMQSLCLIAKQRSLLFMTKVIQALEVLNSNLPPTLAKSQVSCVRKHLKLLLVLLLKHPHAISNRQHQTSIVELLNDLGTTQSEIKKCFQEAQKRGIKFEVVNLDVKRIKLESSDESSGLQRQRSTSEPSTPKVSRAEALNAIEVTSTDLVEKLASLPNVTDLILVSLLSLPDSMPAHFPSAYTPVSAAGDAAQIKHLARLLATQLTNAGLGDGVDQVISRINQASTSMQSQEANEQKFATLIGKTICSEVKKQEQQDKQQKNEQTRVKLLPSGKSSIPATKVKHISIQELTKELDALTTKTLIHSAVDRILLKENEKQTMSLEEQEERTQILVHLASLFSETDVDVNSQLIDYIFQDIRSRQELLLNMLYDKYLECKKSPSRDMSPFLRSLQAVLIAVTERADEKDRDNVLSRILLESPIIPIESFDFLNNYVMTTPSVQSVEQALNILKELIRRRKTVRKNAVSSLLQLSVCQEKQEVRSQALKLIKDVHQTYGSDIKEDIEEFARNQLEYLCRKEPPVSLSRGDTSTWTEDLVRLCLMPYLNLLSNLHSLVHGLATVYVSTEPDVKRVILRSLESPVKGMGMESPELLSLVETCPKGAETLVTRIIHVLTDKQPPSSELVSRVRDLYHKRVADVRFLIPVLNGLTKKEVIAALPKLIKLNPIVVKEVFNRLLGMHHHHAASESSASFKSPLSPADLLIALHSIDASKCDIKTVIKATSLCFAEKNIYTQEVLAVVIQLLVEQTPLPTLFMRTVIQSLSLYPRLVGFIMNILQRLILKQVWKQKKVWEGFIMCCQRTKPQSFQVLLQLPVPQLKAVFSSSPDFKTQLQHHLHAFTDVQRSHIPPSIMEAIYSEEEEQPQQQHEPLTNNGTSSQEEITTS